MCSAACPYFNHTHWTYLVVKAPIFSLEDPLPDHSVAYWKLEDFKFFVALVKIKTNLLPRALDLGSSEGFGLVFINFSTVPTVSEL